MVEATWAVTGTTVPFTLHTAHSPLAQLILAGLAVAAGVACRATVRPLGQPARTAVRGVLFLTTPVFATGSTALPAYFVTLAAGSGLESATGLAHVLLSTAVLVLVALSYRRRLAGVCPAAAGSTPAATTPHSSVLAPRPPPGAPGGWPTC
ncbi:hypothetical protein ACFV0H_11380 [Streptomyces erythrochromogenes]|uniref:hypothetical protein n=1 Tax=Streptomyces erythrochromogenes TaxID=285574 RepID=UPI00369B7551